MTADISNTGGTSSKPARPIKPEEKGQPAAQLLIKPTGGEDVDGGKALTQSLKSAEDSLKSGVIV